jgi:hypothetical protein
MKVLRAESRGQRAEAHSSTFHSERPEDWRQSASCAGLDTDLFFTNQISGQVRRMCAACPVNQECGQFADETGSYGMWGGKYRPFRAAYSKRADIDVVAIDRVLGGEPAELRPAERARVVHLLRMEGLTFGEIEDRTGIPKRSAVRIMSRDAS